MQKIIVAIIGTGLIGLIYWFFFGKKPSFAEAECITPWAEGHGMVDEIDILVDGGYKPSAIKIKKDRTTKLIFKRTDPNTCLEEINIPDFKVKEYLPLNQKIEIKLTPKKAGTFQTHCGMGMFHGKIIVS